MIKILFVCLGNICRSPMAEAIFRQKATKYSLEGHFKIDSAGTGPWHVGKDPDYRTIAATQKNNIPIHHKGRQFSPKDSSHDYILAMDSNNLSTVLELLGSQHNGLYLMRYFDPTERDSDVPDPYYGGEKDFQQVFDILDRSCEALLLFLKDKHHL